MKKSPIHENADANITCDIGDGDISRLGVAYLTHVIHNYLDYIKIIVWDLTGELVVYQNSHCHVSVQALQDSVKFGVLLVNEVK